MMERLHDETTAFFSRLDGGGAFREDRWDRPGGGGGVARVLADGRDVREGGDQPLGGERACCRPARRSGWARGVDAARMPQFYATGMSLVVAPAQPDGADRAPQRALLRPHRRRTGRTLDVWLGGGTDLTPDLSRSPRTRRTSIARSRPSATGTTPSFYPRFKSWCDHYFVNTHRGDERRGIGGIFFDNLRDGDERLDRSTSSSRSCSTSGGCAADGVRADRRAPARTSLWRAGAAVPARAAGPVRRVQPGARPGHDVRAPDQRPDRERAHEPSAAGRMGVRAGVRAGDRSRRS